MRNFGGWPIYSLSIMVMVSWTYSTMKTDQVIQFEDVKLIVHQLYFNKPVGEKMHACG